MKIVNGDRVRVYVGVCAKSLYIPNAASRRNDTSITTSKIIYIKDLSYAIILKDYILILYCSCNQ